MNKGKSIIEKHYGVDVHKPFMMRENYCKSDHLPFGSPHLPFEKPAVKCAESVHKNMMSMDFKIKTRGMMFVPEALTRLFT